MTMPIYQFDSDHIFTGETREIQPHEGAALGWTRTAPPEIPEGKLAQFSSGQWAIIAERPAPPPEPVPDRVSQRRARLVLLRHGMLDDIPDLIAAIEGDAERKAAEIEWEYAGYIGRHSDLVITLATKKGLTPEQIDDMFREADLIPD